MLTAKFIPFTKLFSKLDFKTAYLVFVVAVALHALLLVGTLVPQPIEPMPPASQCRALTTGTFREVPLYNSL